MNNSPAPEPDVGRSWRDDAACLDQPSEWFTDPADRTDIDRALATCATCPVRTSCLTVALSQPEYGDVGIWGGTTPTTRQRIRAAQITVDQDRIDAFADATGDDQWIHVDPERAAAESPFGTTIAHGYLTQSLTNLLVPQVVEVRGFAMGVNYGPDKVRFPAAVPVGSRIRAAVELVEMTDVPGGLQLRTRITVELEGSDKPACVVEALSRFLG